MALVLELAAWFCWQTHCHNSCEINLSSLTRYFALLVKNFVSFSPASMVSSLIWSRYVITNLRGQKIDQCFFAFLLVENPSIITFGNSSIQQVGLLFPVYMTLRNEQFFVQWLTLDNCRLHLPFFAASAIAFAWNEGVTRIYHKIATIRNSIFLLWQKNIHSRFSYFSIC